MSQNQEESHQDVSDEIADAVRRALVQAAEMRDTEEKAREVGERISKMTPPPHTAEEGAGRA